MCTTTSFPSFTFFFHIHWLLDCPPSTLTITWQSTHTRLTALCPGLSRWAGTTKVKPIWILLEQEIVSDSGISWAICKSAASSRQITMPALHYSVFYRPDALPAAQPTASRLGSLNYQNLIKCFLMLWCLLWSGCRSDHSCLARYQVIGTSGILCDRMGWAKNYPPESWAYFCRPHVFVRHPVLCQIQQFSHVTSC